MNWRPFVLAAVSCALVRCEACRSDETLATSSEPRAARLVRKHELGSRLADRDHVVLEVELERSHRLEVCETTAGPFDLVVSSDGSSYGMRCGDTWKTARIVGGALFADCPPPSGLRSGFESPAIKGHAARMFDCVDGVARRPFLRALERELATPDFASALLAIEIPTREAWAEHVLDVGEASRSEVLRALCTELRAPSTDVQRAARAATICPLDDPHTWSARALAPLVKDASEAATFLLEWELLATMHREPNEAGLAACALLARDPTNGVAALVWSETGARCEDAEAALVREPPCGRALDCGDELCAPSSIERRGDGARARLVDAKLPRTTANWTSQAADGHAGYVVEPELLLAAAISKRGPFTDELRRRNARRRYARPAEDPTLEACSSSTPAGARCRCDRLVDDSLDLCGDARWRNVVEVGDCAIVIDDAKRQIVGAVGATKR